jgi:hypothetical protein
MSLRLSLELLQRRHGWRLQAALATAMMLAGIAITVAWPAPVPATVLPVDGSRQLEERHRAFRGVLLPRTELDTRQRSVLEEAARHGLALGRIDYAFENKPSARFAVATLQMPVRGSYADFRAFLANVLAAQPAAAVDDLSIQRDAAGAGIEARLRLAFHTEAQPESTR